MKPLIVLLAAFAISLLAIKIFRKEYNFALAGRIAMSVMLLFTAIGHFAFTEGMAMMLPPIIPFKMGVIYFTGVIEIAASVGLLIPKLKVLTGWMLILFFILIIPANIHAAVNHVDYQNATTEGNGLAYLWFRVPLQVLFIVWTYLSAVNRHKPN
jgi:uncharacterized membrane protein